MTFFKNCLLRPSILRALDDCKFSQPLKVQEDIIPVGMAGCDIVVEAGPGTGKTSAYVLVALDRIVPGDGIQCVVTTNRKKNATMIGSIFRQLSAHIQPPVKIQYLHSKSQVEWTNPPHVVISVPSELATLARDKTLDFTRVNMFIIDDIDNINCCIEEKPDLFRRTVSALEEVHTTFPEKMQTMCFSRTYPPQMKAEISKLVRYAEHIVQGDHPRAPPSSTRPQDLSAYLGFVCPVTIAEPTLRDGINVLQCECPYKNCGYVCNLQTAAADCTPARAYYCVNRHVYQAVTSTSDPDRRVLHGGSRTAPAAPAANVKAKAKPGAPGGRPPAAAAKAAVKKPLAPASVTRPAGPPRQENPQHAPLSPPTKRRKLAGPTPAKAAKAPAAGAGTTTAAGGTPPRPAAKAAANAATAGATTASVAGAAPRPPAQVE